MQGDFQEHIEILTKLQIQHLKVTKSEDLNKINGLIIPGGESTTIIKLLKSNGCNVIGYDFDQNKVDIASKKGILAFNCSNLNPVEFINESTNNIGADGVIITASAKSDTIMHDAAQMSRKRGRIILVGVVGLDLMRSDFYEKELTRLI